MATVEANKGEDVGFHFHLYFLPQGQAREGVGGCQVTTLVGSIEPSLNQTT